MPRLDRRASRIRFHIFHIASAIVRVNYAAPRSNGGSAIFGFEGATQDSLDSAEGVLAGDLNLAALDEMRAAWNPVYGPAYRYPPAYKRIAKS